MDESGAGTEGYIVIARKWRPTTFDEVVGQEHVTRTLKNAITGGRVAHAYLFTGPRGVGKTTVARVLAKALNCDRSPTVTPCSACAACVEIAQGTSLDVVEIDGASNRGIDEVRNLRESVRYAPVGGKKKVYIIDEVHMLTPEAFNALLKTLEEPPPHVVFVFATTQPLKVPQTIVSRCQRFDFRRISTAAITTRLREICKGDGYKCDDPALALIAQQAEGSMRDAQSMLEQALAFGGGAVTEADIRPMMGLRGSEVLSGIGRAITEGNQKRVIELLSDAFDAGVDPVDLAQSLIEWIRFLLVASIDPGSRELESLTAEARQELQDLARGLSTEHLLCLISMITEAENNLKRASHQRYMLESVIIRMTRARSLTRISDLLEALEGMGGSKAGGPTGAGESTRGARASEPRPPAAGPARERRGDGEPKTDAAPVAHTRAGGPAEGASKDAAGRWQHVVEGLREHKASLASILDLCEPPTLSDGVVWLTLPSAFHESQVLKGENLRILTQRIGELTNTSVVLKTKVITGKEDQASQHAAIAEKHPIVRALIDSLGGKIVDVRHDRNESART
jgi:DNA polymerase-3 subunit gamma/tau